MGENQHGNPYHQEARRQARAITFTGTFPDPRGLLSFKPWNKP